MPGLFLDSDLGLAKWGNFALVVFLGSDPGLVNRARFALVVSLWQRPKCNKTSKRSARKMARPLERKVASSRWARVSCTSCNLLGKNRLGVCKTPILLSQNRASCGFYKTSRHTPSAAFGGTVSPAGSVGAERSPPESCALMEGGSPPQEGGFPRGATAPLGKRKIKFPLPLRQGCLL